MPFHRSSRLGSGGAGRTHDRASTWRPPRGHAQSRTCLTPRRLRGRSSSPHAPISLGSAPSGTPAYRFVSRRRSAWLEVVRCDPSGTSNARRETNLILLFNPRLRVAEHNEPAERSLSG